MILLGLRGLEVQLAGAVGERVGGGVVHAVEGGSGGVGEGGEVGEVGEGGVGAGQGVEGHV